MNPVGLAILLFAICFVLCARRQLAPIGMLFGMLFLTQGQQIQIFGLNMYAIRFLELAGFARVFFRGELREISFGRVDRMFLLLYAYTTIVFIIRSREGVAFQIGAALDAYLCYFTFRAMVQGLQDFEYVLRKLVLLLVPFCALLLIETTVKANVFSSMGGVEYGDWTRGGRPRCQGSFRHPSLLGTLGAGLIPLYIGLGLNGFRKPAFWGFVASVFIVWASNSGGPANMAVIGSGAWLLWRFREHLALVRLAGAAVLVLLALVMNAPIWYLPAKVSAISGGAGWHRSYLMEKGAETFDQWWLAGMPIRETIDWFPYSLASTGGADMTNQYLYFGITAGVFAILLFFTLIYTAFREIGSMLKGGGDQTRSFLFWGCGAALFAHCFNWLGIIYFDQIYLFWYFQIAAIASLIQERRVLQESNASQHMSRLRTDWGSPGPASCTHVSL
jgi:hypothetical protein